MKYDTNKPEFIDMGTGLNYWYFTTHGVQPGSVPRGLNIIDVVDTPSGSFFLTDRVLTTDALKYYDICEKSPKQTEVTSSTAIKAAKETEMEEIWATAIDAYLEIIDNIAYHSGYNMDADVENSTMTFTAMKNEEFMPVITAVRSDEDGYMFFRPTMTCPTLTADDLDYNDSFEYYTGLWVEASKICTYLMDNPLDLANALDEAGFEY